MFGRLFFLLPYRCAPTPAAWQCWPQSAAPPGRPELLCAGTVAAAVTKDLKCYQLLQTYSGISKPYLREWIMAAIVTGTVVLWEVVDPGGPNERVKHVSDETVSVFVPSDETGDDAADAQVLAIISQFLLEKVGEKHKQGEALLNDVRDLLIKGREGLLQVAGIKRTSVKPPPRTSVE
jgi:hypothetical protein